MAGWSEAGRRRRPAWLGLSLSGLVILAVALAPVLTPHDPLDLDLARRLLPPSRAYPLGTDELGRCVASRLLQGGRLSLTTALAAVSLGLGAGLGAGLALGLGGPRARRWLDPVLDAALAFPGLIVALVVAGLLGGGQAGLILGLGLAQAPWWGRFVRGLTLAAQGRDYVLAARAAGVGGGLLLRRYYLTQMGPALASAASLRLGLALAAAAGLGFLGLGPAPPSPDWGAMLRDGRLYLAQAPWLTLAPVGAIGLSILGFNLLAEELEGTALARPGRRE